MPIQIADESIAPGEERVVKLPVGQLSSGNRISIRAHVYRAKQPGPTVLILGGVHGDEINGVEIVRRSIEQAYYDSLQCGSVIAIPLLNIYGFINYSRDVPDGKDVNRSFPGSSNGSLAARVAHALNNHILPKASFGIDFHTGGNGNYNFPQIRYTPNHPEAEELAKAFAAPISLAYKPINKSLRKIAKTNYDIPILIFEGGENLRYDGPSIDHGLAGIQRVLHANGMIESAPPVAHTLRHFSKTSWLRASRAGMFQWLKPAGYAVRKGELLGLITDPHGILKTKRIVSPRDGFIIGHNNSPVISMGDALFHLAVWEEGQEML